MEFRLLPTQVTLTGVRYSKTKASQLEEMGFVMFPRLVTFEFDFPTEDQLESDKDLFILFSRCNTPPKI